MGAKASGSAKAAPQDQHKKVNQKESQSQPSSSPSTHSPASQKPTSASTTLTTSQSQDNSTTHKVIMADRGTSLLMLLIILAMFPAIFGALTKMGVSWKGFLAGGVSMCVAVSVRPFSSVSSNLYSHARS